MTKFTSLYITILLSIWLKRFQHIDYLSMPLKKKIFRFIRPGIYLLNFFI
jgi:hypothetical protein